MYHLITGCPLFIIRAGVGVETAGVLVAPGVREQGVDLEGVRGRKVVRGRGVWCGALWMEALYGGQSWRPEVAVRQAEEEEKGEKEARESVVCEKEPGCWWWTLQL